MADHNFRLTITCSLLEVSSDVLIIACVPTKAESLSVTVYAASERVGYQLLLCLNQADVPLVWEQIKRGRTVVL